MSGLTDTSINGVDVWMLRELGCRALIRCLEELSGRKDLVIDSTLMKMLDRLAQAATLRSHDVDKIFRFEKMPPNSKCSQRIYMTRPTPDAIKLIAEHICHQQQQLQQQQQQQQQQNEIVVLRQVMVLCVPRVTHVAWSVLEEEGLADGGLVTLHPFCPGFVPLDEDLLTMEMPTFFRDAFVEGDLSSCVGVSEALRQVQAVYGRPRRSLAHGRAAHSVVTALHTTASGADGRDKPNTKCEIGQMFVFDRDADLVTPMLTQLTYEGSVDEHFTVQAGVVELPPHVATADSRDKQGLNKVMLNGRDAVFSSVRHKHFAGVAGQLVRRAKEIQVRKEDSKTMTPAQMKEFVANELKELQAQQNNISLHLSICEAITKATRKDFEMQLTTEHGLVTGATSSSEAKAYFEDCCARQLPLNACLRLMCLLSLTQSNGLSIKEYESLSVQLVAACGYRHLISLFELRQAGLLYVADSSGDDTPPSLAMKSLRSAASSFISRDQPCNWRSLTKALKLIPDPDETVDLHNPSHLSYVFNGAYSPALPQLVSVCLTRGAQNVTEALRLLPGSTTLEGWGTEDAPGILPPVVLVVVLGGVTFAELAAFRLVGIRTGNRIIVASTGTCTGNKIIAGVTNSSAGQPP